jgi:hypothetical protein
MMQLLCGVLVSWLLVHATQTAAISPAAATTRNSPPAAVAPNPPHLVLLDHDGGVDDFITLLLLLSGSQKAKLIGEHIKGQSRAGNSHPSGLSGLLPAAAARLNPAVSTTGEAQQQSPKHLGVILWPGDRAHTTTYQHRAWHDGSPLFS